MSHHHWQKQGCVYTITRHPLPSHGLRERLPLLNIEEGPVQIWFEVQIGHQLVAVPGRDLLIDRRSGSREYYSILKVKRLRALRARDRAVPGAWRNVAPIIYGKVEFEIRNHPQDYIAPMQEQT